MVQQVSMIFFNRKGRYLYIDEVHLFYRWAVFMILEVNLFLNNPGLNANIGDVLVDLILRLTITLFITSLYPKRQTTRLHHTLGSI